MHNRPRSRLSPGDVHIRYCLTDSLGEDALADASALLSNEERARRDAFRVDHDRREYAVAHALLRATLSEFGDRPPEAWRFESGALGKPALAPGVSTLPMAFNIAHTLGLVACAVASGADVGLDVEHVSRSNDWRGISRRYFAPSEVAQIAGAAEDEQAGRFFDFWTLKEAFIKALGVGLSRPLNETTFEVGRDGAIRFIPPPDINPAAWQFALYTPTPDHRMAIAVGDGTARQWHISLGLSDRAG